MIYKYQYLGTPTPIYLKLGIKNSYRQKTYKDFLIKVLNVLIQKYLSSIKFFFIGFKIFMVLS